MDSTLQLPPLGSQTINNKLSIKLTDLPEELLLLVIDLCIVPLPDAEAADFTSVYKQRLKLLTSLCLVCKQLDAVARPLLYHTFDKPETPRFIYRRWYGSNRITDNVVLRRFLRTILHRSDLARYVKRLILRRWLNHCVRHHCDFSSTLSLQDERQYKQILTEATDRHHLPGVHEAWRRALLDDYWRPPTVQGAAEQPRYPNYVEDAEIALLILLTPRLQSLAMEAPSRPKFDDTQFDQSVYPPRTIRLLRTTDHVEG